MLSPMAHDSDGQEALRLQLQQAIDTVRYQFGLIVQIWGFLIAGDALLVGLGLSQNKPVLLAIACVIPLIMIMTAERIASHALPFLLVSRDVACLTCRCCRQVS